MRDDQANSTALTLWGLLFIAGIVATVSAILGAQWLIAVIGAAATAGALHAMGRYDHP
jgi:amino acid transporter